MRNLSSMRNLKAIMKVFSCLFYYAKELYDLKIFIFIIGMLVYNESGLSKWFDRGKLEKKRCFRRKKF